MERWIMAEVPSVVFRLPDYAKAGITGVSIGSNDLTQLMLGVDRDSELFGAGYDERDEAVLDAIQYDRHRITQARTDLLDLRSGAVGSPGIRRAAGRVGDRLDLRERGRDRAHAPQHCRGRTVAHPGRGPAPGPSVSAKRRAPHEVVRRCEGASFRSR